MRLNIRNILLSFLFVLAAPMTLNAQSYSMIDGDLSLYCADLPDGTNSLVTVVSNKGLHTVNPVDPEAEKVAISKRVKDLQKRIKNLKKIKKDYEPSEDIKYLKKTYKLVASQMVNDLDSDGSLDKLSPSKIHKRIGALIAQLNLALTELHEAYDKIDRCIRNEDLIPAPTAPSANVIIFTFKHPDYGTTEVMRGLGVTAILNKKRITGQLCVSTSKVHSSLNKFPQESIRTISRNPCLMFFQTAFRNFPLCHYGAHADNAVGWFSSTEAGFSQSAVSDSELEKLENKLANLGPIYVRAPTKKKPCRTSK